MQISKNGYVTFCDGPKYKNGEIVSTYPIPNEVLNSPIVVFKQVFPVEFIHALRKTVINYEYKHFDYEMDQSGLAYNYMRVDDLRSREKRARYNINYSFYFWNKDTPSMVLDMYYAMTKFGNMISGRDVNERLNLNSDVLSAMAYAYYPAQGLLDSHHFSDDLGNGYNEKFDELVIQFSKFGEDYFKGGVHVAPRYKFGLNYVRENHGEPQFIEHLLDPGDIMAITIKDVYHIVEPIDPDLNYKDPHKGRFIGMLYYVPQKDFKTLTNK